MVAGMAVILLASAFLGTFALPAKYIKGRYAWENTWGAFFLFAMLIVPVGLAMIIVDGLWQTYADVSGGVIFGVIALGFVWGCGFCLWGHGLARLGLSLGYALTMGTMALVGSMLPFFLGHAHQAATVGGMIVILGILVCIGGVAINGVAGLKREQGFEDNAPAGWDRKKTLTGVIICVLAGLFSSGLNIGFHIGNNIGGIEAISVEKFGNPVWVGSFATWTLIFLGGLISSFGFAVMQLFRNKTWGNFLIPGTGINLFLTFLMAVGHTACLVFYGIGGLMMGVLGTSVGFAIFQSGSVLIGNGFGFMTGEWENATSESKKWLAMGLAVLIAGIVILSIGNILQTGG
jgi:L-rhamnose-H+ transport protein